LPIEKVLEQVDISLEDFQDKLSKDLPDDLPSSRSNQPTLELAPIDPPSTNHEVWTSIPIDQHSYIKVSLFSFEPVPESPSYFLPFPEPSHSFRAMGLLFVEITIMHDSLEPIPFATYFWYTLWNLLEIHGNFSCAY